MRIEAGFGQALFFSDTKVKLVLSLEDAMVGLVAVLYGICAYAVFLFTILYAVGFVGNLVVPKSIDSGVGGPLVESLVVNVMLLVLLLLYWQWRPMPAPIWIVHNPLIASALNATAWFGWSLLFASTFMLNHFELQFRTPLLYRLIRHPLYLSFLLAFWATPSMTAGHLLFAVATTGYILIAIQLEERDLIDIFGEQYRRYRQQVAMLIPWPGRKPVHITDADTPSRNAIRDVEIQRHGTTLNKQFEGEQS